MCAILEGCEKSAIERDMNFQSSPVSLDFCAPYKIGQNKVEMVPCVAVLCRAGRGERGCHRVLAGRAQKRPCVEIRPSEIC